MKGRRGRIYLVAAVSVVLHAGLLILVATHAPRLFSPPVASGPPEPIIPILILPRTPPRQTAAGLTPAPIRLHRRPQRFAPSDLPVAPLVVSQPEPQRPAVGPAPRPVALPASRDATAEGVGRALRGRLGCANLAALTRAERQACEDRLASGARDAAFPGLGLEGGKAAGFEAEAARKAADQRYRSAPPPRGTLGTGRNSGAIEKPGAPNLGMGATGLDVGAMTGNDRPEAKTKF